MQTNDRATARDHTPTVAQPDIREIVMGLHWDPPVNGSAAKPEDLDALCMLLDAKHEVLETIHPGHVRNANGSVIHTGDSKTGASEWDDERIFVFLDALPDAVATVSFVVISATGRAFGEVRGASCHVSDHATEREWVRVNLTMLKTHTAYCVANACRDASGWRITTDAHIVHDRLLAELSSRVEREKTAKLAQSGPQ